MFKFRYGKIVDQIDILPYITMFLYKNYMFDCLRPKWNFCISVQWNYMVCRNKSRKRL